MFNADPDSAHTLGDVHQGCLILDLPACVEQIILSAGMNHEPVEVLVHPQTQRAVRFLAGDLKAQNVRSVYLPGVYVAHTDSQVAELRYRHFLSPPDAVDSFTRVQSRGRLALTSPSWPHIGR